MKRSAFSFVCIFVLASSLPLAADPKPKEPWEWTDEERVAARLDETAAAARVRAARDAAVTAVETNRPLPPPRDVIQGSRDAHLLLPWEIFDWLISTAYVDDTRFREAYRATKEEYRTQLELPDDMWIRLEAIAAPLIEDRRRERAVGQSKLPPAERDAHLAVIRDLVCRDRFTALSEARREFGPAFDRFLYTAIAGSVNTTVHGPHKPELLLATSRGCA